MSKTLSAAVLLLTAAFAQAQTPPPGGNANHPCVLLHQEAESACTTAGYVKGWHKKTFPQNPSQHMGLIDDCMHPIMQTFTVPWNVNGASLTSLQACKTKRQSEGQAH